MSERKPDHPALTPEAREHYLSILVKGATIEDRVDALRALELRAAKIALLAYGRSDEDHELALDEARRAVKAHLRAFADELGLTKNARNIVNDYGTDAMRQFRLAVREALREGLVLRSAVAERANEILDRPAAF